MMIEIGFESSCIKAYHVWGQGLVNIYIKLQCAADHTCLLFFPFAVGPELPHTIDNKEWEDATKEKLIRTKANPILGISSKA